VSPTHVDEMTYLFNIPLIPEYVDDEDYQLSKKMIKLWTSFASTG